MIETVKAVIPFEGDTFIGEELFKLKEKFGIKQCIETGTQYGYTTKELSKIFDSVYTIEASRVNFSKALEITNEERNIVALLGNSEQILKWWAIFKDTLFYLDAHSNGQCPLKEELEVIATKTPTNICIAIHDFKVPGHPELGYDTYDFELCYEEIEPYLNKIYPDGFDYHYNDKADGAERGIIYIYPKTK